VQQVLLVLKVHKVIQDHKDRKVFKVFKDHREK
jgi:hypothetical protein